METIIAKINLISDEVDYLTDQYSFNEIIQESIANYHLNVESNKLRIKIITEITAKINTEFCRIFESLNEINSKNLELNNMEKLFINRFILNFCNDFLQLKNTLECQLVILQNLQEKINKLYLMQK